MEIIKYKKFHSIDGFFNGKLRFLETRTLNMIKKNKSFSVIGKGNSISALPFDKGTLLIDFKENDKIKLDQKKSIITVNGSIAVYKIHNFLLKNNFYFPSFPSYSYVTAGACVANCVHGLNPKNGVMKDFVKEIKIYNPNFGFKILSEKKNSKLFDLTIGGMGLTGIIVSIQLKVLKLKSTNLRIEKNLEFNELFDMYKYLLKNKFFYNQNNIFLDFKKNKVLGRFTSGNLDKKKIKLKFITPKKIYPIRLNFFSNNIFKTIFERLILLKEKSFQNRNMHVNDAFYPSNSRLLYFYLMKKKFIEYQTIIPHKNVKIFLKELRYITDKYSPLISLCHMKLFNGKSKYLQFNGKGLALSVHLTINSEFNIFYKKLNYLNNKHKCKINIYKNSLVKIDDIKKSYGKNYKQFEKEIKKINNKYIIVNRIFNKKNFYKKN